MHFFFLNKKFYNLKFFHHLLRKMKINFFFKINYFITLSNSVFSVQIKFFDKFFLNFSRNRSPSNATYLFNRLINFKSNLNQDASSNKTGSSQSRMAMNNNILFIFNLLG